MNRPKTGDGVEFQMGMTVYFKGEPQTIGNLFDAIAGGFLFSTIDYIVQNIETALEKIVAIDTTKPNLCLTSDGQIGLIERNEITAKIPLNKTYSTPQSLLQADIAMIKNERSEHWDRFTRAIETLEEKIKELENASNKTKNE